MKKAVIVFSIFCLAVVDSIAQQIPLYSLNFDNRFLYNPARTGFNGNPELYLMYRKQWLDFRGAPETRAVSFDTNFKRGGVGMYVFNDISDVFRTWGGYLSYAYHIPFKSEVHRLSIGLSAGLQDYSFDREKAHIKDPLDPLLQGNRGLSFDGSAGLHYYASKGSFLNLSVGLSAISIYATDLQFLNNASPSTLFIPDRHYAAILSNRLKLANEKFILEPMLVTRFTEAFNYQIEPGLLIGFKDWIWVSGLYRYDYGVTIGAGFKVHDAVKLGYAYDLALNDIRGYTDGTHELMLGIIFGKKKDKEAENEINQIKERQAQQDSVFNDMKEQQDSLLNIIDELSYQIEDLQYRIDSLESMEFEIDPESLKQLIEAGELIGEPDATKKKAEMDALTKEIDKMKKEMDQLKQEKDKVEKTVPKTKTDEMTEQRTRVVSEDDLEVKRGPALGDYFMVVGSFRIEQNSYNFQEDLKKRGYDAGVVYDKKRKWYYVFIAQPKDLKEGLKDLIKLREENPEFHDAWIHIMSRSVR